ncbi:Gfo/Idh/MocA family oxidoreductase [soil metagenome]
MIGVGIVGAGFWSRLVQVPSFQSIPGWDLVGIASGHRQNAADLAAEFGIRKVFDDYEQLIDDPQIQVVNIVTPNYLHREIAVRALSAGKDVICIKPLAHTLADAEAIVAAAEKYGRQIFYAENVTFTPTLEAFKSLVDAGTYGDVFRFKSMHGVGGPHASWFFDPKLSGGGCIIDMAVHGLAYLDWFSGHAGVKSVHAEAGTFLHTEHSVEDTSVLQLRFDDDRMGQTEDSWSMPGGFDGRYEAFGTRGHGFVDLLYGHPIRSVTGGNDEGGSNGVRYHAVDEHFVKDGHRGMMAHFLEVLESGIPNRSSGIDGLRIMQLVDAAYNSVRSGTPSRVTLVKES